MTELATSNYHPKQEISDTSGSISMESSAAPKLESRTRIELDRFHPLFSTPDGDVILAAKGGEVFFRVYSFTLRMTSGFFKTMYTLPQKNTPTANDVVYTDEDAYTLESLLRMICGLPLLAIETYDQLDSLLFAAEKYDMPGPISILRLQAMTPQFLEEPFRLYAAASRHGWDAEKGFSSTQTLTYNIHDPALRELLQRLSTQALLDIFQLHHSRREGLRVRLNEPPFVPGTPTVCPSCNAKIDYHTWRELKYKIILEMDARPLGDTILEQGLLEWPESLACWDSKCPCGRLLYDKAETLKVIRECIDALPKSL